jgi:restriction system protein
MARRRKNEKSLEELAFGLIAFVIFASIVSPTLRKQLLSLFSTIFGFVILFGLLGIIAYLVKLMINKSKNHPIQSEIRRRDPNPNPAPYPPLNPAPNPIHPQSTNTPNQPYVNNGLAPPDYHINNDLSLQYVPEQRKWDVSVLKEIEWKRFETVCTEFLRIAGFVATETNIGADGGVDIRVHKPEVENSEGIIQCKAWNTYNVGVKPVRELFGIMAAERISTGILMTSGSFTLEAVEWAKGKVNLIGGEKFIGLIKKLSEENQKGLLDVALEGDYRTPTCPQCDVKLILREVKKGRNEGGKFWGCVNYPRCKQTLIYKEAQ